VVASVSAAEPFVMRQVLSWFQRCAGMGGVEQCSVPALWAPPSVWLCRLPCLPLSAEGVC
jgi:hypothetical protein